MKRLTVIGKTYGIKDLLKENGFRWNQEGKFWCHYFEDDNQLNDWLDRLGSVKDVSTEVKTFTNPNEKKYFVKESWIFNLESMHDRVYCLIYDVRDKKIELPFTVAGKTINSEDDLFEILEEAEKLECIAKHGKVTSRQYGRIREIVAWRVEARYFACLAAGMDEAQAGQCFEDM